MKAGSPTGACRSIYQWLQRAGTNEAVFGTSRRRIWVAYETVTLNAK